MIVRSAASAPPVRGVRRTRLCSIQRASLASSIGSRRAHTHQWRQGCGQLYLQATIAGLNRADLRRPGRQMSNQLLLRLLGMPSVLQAASSLCPAYFSPESTKKAAHVGDRWWISSAYVCYQFVIVGCTEIVAAARQRSAHSSGSVVQDAAKTQRCGFAPTEAVAAAVRRHTTKH